MMGGHKELRMLESFAQGNLTASFAVINGYQLLIEFLFINRTSVFTIDAHQTAAVKQDSLTVDTVACVLQVLQESIALKVQLTILQKFESWELNRN